MVNNRKAEGEVNSPSLCTNNRRDGYAYCFDGNLTYSFFSEGEKGRIPIKARFEPFHVDQKIYHFEFGLWIPSENRIDTSVVIDNRDVRHILRTVTRIICDFMEKDPRRLVRVCGSTVQRTRLFSIWVTTHLEELEKRYVIYGYQSGKLWSKYKKNVRYESILFKKKDPGRTAVF